MNRSSASTGGAKLKLPAARQRSRNSHPQKPRLPLAQRHAGQTAAEERAGVDADAVLAQFGRGRGRMAVYCDCIMVRQAADPCEKGDLDSSFFTLQWKTTNLSCESRGPLTG